MLLVVVLCIACVAFGLYRAKNKMRLLYLSRNIPGPPCLPLLGNALLFVGRPAQEYLPIIYRLSVDHGPVFTVWLGTELYVFLYRPRDLDHILGNGRQLDKSVDYTFLRLWLNEGLLLSTGNKWFRRRKILTAAFHFRILEQFVDVFERNSRVFIESLLCGSASHGGATVLGDLIHLFTLDGVCETSMGVSIEAQRNSDSDYVRAVKTISYVLHKRMFNIFYRLNTIYQFTTLAYKERQALSVLHGFTEKIIHSRRRELLKSQSKAADENVDDDDNIVGSQSKVACLLDILLRSEDGGQPLTDLDIREEVDTFVFEGHDTTSSAITFFFYNIALNPECQQKCFEEVYALFGANKHSTITYEHLNSMHYIELCIKETLRLYPSVPMLGRKILHDCQIGDKTIPAGTNIGICPLHLGHLEEIFPDAEKFIPERFDVVKTATKRNPYAYIPFSAGPRNCIGQKFAMLEIKTLIANVLRHFEIEYAGDPNEPPVLIAELILRTKDPLLFKMKPRNYG